MVSQVCALLSEIDGSATMMCRLNISSRFRVFAVQTDLDIFSALSNAYYPLNPIRYEGIREGFTLQRRMESGHICVWLLYAFSILSASAHDGIILLCSHMIHCK